MKNILILIIICFLAISCSDGIVSECETDLSNIVINSNFNSIQKNIFNKNCATSGCHIGTFAAAGLDLSEGNAYKNIVGVKSSSNLMYIEPGNSNNSYLFQRISSQNIGNVMPPTGRLNQKYIDSLKLWIDNGAPNN